MKTSEKLYSLNAQISLNYIGLKKTPTYNEMRAINKCIGEAIKEVRILEDTQST